jgi:hypothetical protein
LTLHESQINKLLEVPAFLYAPAATFNDVDGNQVNVFIDRRTYIIDGRTYIDRRAYIIDGRTYIINHHVHNTTEVLTPHAIAFLTIGVCIILAFNKYESYASKSTSFVLINS